MCQEDQAAKDEKRNRRKRRSQTIAYGFLLSMGCVYCGVFITIAWTGYLTWIGIAVGTIFLAPNIVFSALGLAEKETLAKRLGRVWACLMITTLVVLGALVFWPERPGPWKPYSFDPELAALEAERAVPDEDNAALRYEAALAAVDVNDRPDLGKDTRVLLRQLSQEPWRAESQPEVSAWLDAHAPVIAELQQIGQMEQCRWPMYANSDCDWTVPYKRLAYGGRLLTLAGNRHLGEGGFDEAERTCFCLLRHAGHMWQQTHAVDFRFAFGLERRALRMIRHILVHSELSPEDMERIARRLPNTANTWHQDIDRLLRFDEYRFAQFMAPVYEINDQGEVRFADWLPFCPEEQPDRKSFRRIAKLRPLYYHLNMPLDPQGVWAIARRESARMRRFLEPGPVLGINSDDLNPFEPLLDFLARAGANWARCTARTMCFDDSSYADFGEFHAAHLTQRRGTWLVLGLRRYRDEHGAWPESLDSVAEHVPADAFLDPTSGDRFVYARDGDSFKLYSTGLNRIDEGGRDDYVKTLDRCEDDIAIWPPYVRQPEPETTESTELMKKQLTEIHGEDALSDKE